MLSPIVCACPTISQTIIHTMDIKAPGVMYGQLIQKGERILFEVKNTGSVPLQARVERSAPLDIISFPLWDEEVSPDEVQTFSYTTQDFASYTFYVFSTQEGSGTATVIIGPYKFTKPAKK